VWDLYRDHSSETDPRLPSSSMIRVETPGGLATQLSAANRRRPARGPALVGCPAAG